ncbi:MAG: hypothetical protein ACLP3R_20910, partial [Candidatus Korobacteraceae bacterium]
CRENTTHHSVGKENPDELRNLCPTPDKWLLSTLFHNLGSKVPDLGKARLKVVKVLHGVSVWKGDCICPSK